MSTLTMKPILGQPEVRLSNNTIHFPTLHFMPLKQGVEHGIFCVLSLIF